MKVFKNLNYDLSQNILRYNKGIESLKDYSLNIHIGKVFKEFFIKKYEEIKLFIQDKKEIHKIYDKWGKIEQEVDDEIFKDLDLSYSVMFGVIRRQRIHFIGTQIIDFLKKYPIHQNLVTIKHFIRFIVFTGQGTINLSKSVSKVYENPNRFALENFKIACHFFLENEILKCYKSLNDNEIKVLLNDTRKGYIIEFWLSEISFLNSNSQNLNPNYLQAKIKKYKKFLNAAISTNNEIAVAYLWNNKISKLTGSVVILGNTLKWIVNHSSSTNILMFLLFQVHENDIFDDFWESSFFTIIKNVVKDIRWVCVFDKIFNVLNMHRISKVFGILTNSHCKVYPKGINLEYVVNYFSSMSDCVKHIIVNESTPAPIPDQFRNNYERIFPKVIESGKEDLINKFTKAKDGTDLKKIV